MNQPHLMEMSNLLDADCSKGIYFWASQFGALIDLFIFSWSAQNIYCDYTYLGGVQKCEAPVIACKVKGRSAFRHLTRGRELSDNSVDHSIRSQSIII